MAGEVVVGVLANSLALLSDAAHLLTDAAALAACPGRAAAGPPAARRRLHVRPETGRDPLRPGQRDHAAAARGLAGVRGGAPAAGSAAGVRRGGAHHGAGRYRGQPRRDLVRRGGPIGAASTSAGAYLHLLTDLAAFIATAVAGLVMLLTGFRRADADRVAGRGGADGPRRRRAGPRQRPDPARGGAGRAGPDRDRHRDGRAPRAWSEVHDLHVWEISSGSPALSAHVLVAPGARLPPGAAAISSGCCGSVRAHPHHAAGRPRPTVRRSGSARTRTTLARDGPPAAKLPRTCLSSTTTSRSRPRCGGRWSTRACGSASPATASARWSRRASDPPDLVVLDLMLPGLDGLTVCEQLRARAGRHARAHADRPRRHGRPGARARRRSRRLPGQAVRLRGAAGPGTGAAAAPEPAARLTRGSASPTSCSTRWPARYGGASGCST